MTTLIGIFFSAAGISIALAGIILLLEMLLKTVWDIEEFTGSFWKVLNIIKKVLTCLAVLLACIALFTGMIYLIKLTFDTGMWSSTT